MPVDEEVAVTAAQLRATHRSLRLPDALVLATAPAVKADAVLTGDEQWLRIDSRVQLISSAAANGLTGKAAETPVVGAGWCAPT